MPKPSSPATFRPLLADVVCSACGKPAKFMSKNDDGFTATPLSDCCRAEAERLRERGAAETEDKEST